MGWVGGLGSWKQAGKNSLRGRYGRPRQRPGDTSQFVFIYFFSNFTHQLRFRVFMALDRRQKVWNGLKEGFGPSKLPIWVELAALA